MRERGLDVNDTKPCRTMACRGLPEPLETGTCRDPLNAWAEAGFGVGTGRLTKPIDFDSNFNKWLCIPTPMGR